MSHIEFTAIERKIKDTETELKSIALCSDEIMRSIMTSELRHRLFELQKQKKEMENALQIAKRKTGTYGSFEESMERKKC